MTQRQERWFTALAFLILSNVTDGWLSWLNAVAALVVLGFYFFGGDK